MHYYRLRSGPTCKVTEGERRMVSVCKRFPIIKEVEILLYWPEPGRNINSQTMGEGGLLCLTINAPVL